MNSILGAPLSEARVGWCAEDGCKAIPGLLRRSDAHGTLRLRMAEHGRCQASPGTQIIAQ